MEKDLRNLYINILKRSGLLQKNEASCCGITAAQCHALSEIGRNGGVSIKVLSDETGLDKSTLSRTIDNLVEAGLVLRTQSKDDRRRIEASLTAEGVAVYIAIEKRMEQFFEQIIRLIPEDKITQVKESIVILAEAFGRAECC